MRNCLSYAVTKWWREGGYIAMRRSLAWELFAVGKRPWYSPARLVIIVPHFLHFDRDGQMTQYVPTPQQVARHKRCLLKFFFSLLYFRGHVVKGDAAYLSRDYEGK